MIKWLKRQFAILALGMSNLEKNVLGQDGHDLSDDTNVSQKQRVNQLADDLIQGRITQEVVFLRARLYKVIEASDELENTVKPRLNVQGEIVGYDITESTKKPIHKKIKGDPFDDAKVEMVINNETITASVTDTFDRIGEYGVEQNNTIVINRDFRPKIEFEKYTTKLFVRDLNDGRKLLEFYIPKYTDLYDRKTAFLISSIKKAIDRPKNSDLVDIKSIGFMTYNDVGVKDFREFYYVIEAFDKIVEHDGNYIIKFIGRPMVENEAILEKYRNEVLDEKYKNKEFKGKR